MNSLSVPVNNCVLDCVVIVLYSNYPDKTVEFCIETIKGLLSYVVDDETDGGLEAEWVIMGIN
jgi:hypothetical protein